MTRRVLQEIFAGWFPGAKEVAEMLADFEAHTYLAAALPVVGAEPAVATP